MFWPNTSTSPEVIGASPKMCIRDSSIIEPTIKFNLGGYNNMKNNRYLTIGLLTGFIVGGCMGVLGWAFLQNLFAIPICAGIGMLIGIVIGTLIDYGKNHQEK